MIESATALPRELNQRFQGMALANESLMLSQQYDEARKGFQQIYDMLLQEQPLSARYHKGYALHQIGMTLLLAGKPQDALRYFVLAYIEDLLLQKEGEEDKAEEMPASKNLRRVYRVSDSALDQLKEIVRRRKKRGELKPYELAYIRSQLRQSPSLRRRWGFRPSAKRFSEKHIRAVARDGLSAIRKPVLASAPKERKFTK